MREYIVVSVDWSYFFPTVLDFGWPLREDSDVDYEKLWAARALERSPISGDLAFDELRPNLTLLRDFWKKAAPKDPIVVAISDTHSDILDLLFRLRYPDVHLYNYDIHHDILSTTRAPKGIKAASYHSWGYYCKVSKHINRFHWIHPKQVSGANVHHLYSPERACPPATEWISEGTRFITDHVNVDMVFICRSYAWTPPWADRQWLQFIKYWETRPKAWSNRIGYGKYEELRKPTKEDIEKRLGRNARNIARTFRR